MKLLRKIFLVSLSAATLFVSLACQATPEKTAVVKKDNYEENDKKETEYTILSDYAKTLPENVNDSFENQAISINVNAKIKLPNREEKLPIYKYQPHILTQEEADKWIDYFAKGKKYYKLLSYTKEWYDE